MFPQTKLRSALGDIHRDGEGSTTLSAKIDLLERQLWDVVSQRDSLAMETSVLKQLAETLEPEICSMRAALLQAQQEIERLKEAADAKIGAASATADAILAFIHERHNPSIQRIATRFGLSQDEARSALGELQRSGLASPLNLQNGVQRWIVVKKGVQYLEDRQLLSQTFRQKSASRVYW
jgi:hypothetical protein